MTLKKNVVYTCLYLKENLSPGHISIVEYSPSTQVALGSIIGIKKEKEKSSHSEHDDSNLLIPAFRRQKECISINSRPAWST